MELDTGEGRRIRIAESCRILYKGAATESRCRAAGAAIRRNLSAAELVRAVTVATRT